MKFLTPSLVCASLICTIKVVAYDATLVAETSGSQVVDACVGKIKSSRIFPQDYSFLRRIAYVESKDGTDQNTYRSAYHGGIWQVDKIGFESTQDTTSHPALVGKHSQIQKHFDIEWTAVKWHDLRKPFYSALAARLFLSNKQGAIPNTMEQQAQYWKNSYNSNDPNAAGSPEKFMRDVRALESRDSKCDLTEGRMFITFVLDGSGSIGRSNYQKALVFLEDVVEKLGMSSKGPEVAMLYYSNYVYSRFNFTADPFFARSKIQTTRYPGGGTSTGGAIKAAVNMFAPLKGSREHLNRICIVLTDGNSHDSVAKPAAMAHAEGINMLAIGIGNNIDDSTLLGISNNISEHVLHVGSYTSINNALWTLIQSTCKLPVQLKMTDLDFAIAVAVRGTLGKNKMKYVASPVPESGITVDLEQLKGSVVGYASYMSSAPSKAFYDYMLQAGQRTYIPPPASGISGPRQLQSTRVTAGNATMHVLYMGYQGKEEENTFQVSVMLGNTWAVSLGQRVSTCSWLLYLSITPCTISIFKSLV